MEETLTSKKDIRELFASGKRATNPPLTIIYRANALEKNRFLYCPERSVGKAVRRNRIRRRLRAAVTETAGSFPKGFDIAILAKPSLFDKDHSQLLACLSLLAQKIK
ncbi:ribonuclease P protein component [Leptospira langatensis]|uniref:Ribonuclease P protein component n=1 Tax=Leptospira langatensis TaxID=2484983 RepID=A0A5F1ZV42_9LEPT|nr:ribonuclease P protein component [Leptospira langatensis]TGK03234.1 ribonuclease P protein component [Leptospira langatensis]TGL42409.1 ribonuclease P protein component [Leptospira langatensis]